MVMRENDEGVILFHEMDTGINGRDDLLLFGSSDEFINASPESYPRSAPIFKIAPLSTGPGARQTAVDEFLSSENDKSDSDWLLTPPGTPPFFSTEKEAPIALMPHNGNSVTRPTELKSKLQHDHSLSISARVDDESSPNSILSSTMISLDPGNRSLSSSGGRSTASSSSRSATPIGRTTLATAAKPSRSSTPTSRPTLSATRPSAVLLGSSTTRRSSTPTARPSSTLSNKSATRSASTTRRSSTPTARPSSNLSTKSAPRSATPTARTSIPNLKSASRSSTPTARPSLIANISASRSSTPTARPSVPATKSAPRSSTPTCRKSTSSAALTLSAPPGKIFPSATKAGPSAAKNPAPPRSHSPTVRSKTLKPSVLDRPVSASKCRPGRGVTAHSLPAEADSTESQRRQSLSASRARALVTTNAQNSKSSVTSMSRTRSSNNDDYVNPVEIGTQMVERVVNMRKLVPPKQDTDLYNNTSRKSSDSSGFGRSLSKKSLDMALRHMDIQRSMSGTLRPLMTNIPASSLYSLRSGSTKGSRSVAAVSDSPVATSSDPSSELIMNNNCQCVEGSDIDDDDPGSERGSSAPISLNDH